LRLAIDLVEGVDELAAKRRRRRAAHRDGRGLPEPLARDHLLPPRAGEAGIFRVEGATLAVPPHPERAVISAVLLPVAVELRQAHRCNHQPTQSPIARPIVSVENVRRLEGFIDSAFALYWSITPVD
jgi:hypothetical protein